MIKKVLRNDVISIICQYRMKLIFQRDLIDTLNCETKDTASALFDTIKQELEGCTNGFLSEFYQTLTGEAVEVVGDTQKLFTCPCCGFKTLLEIYDIQQGTGYDICRYCQWEDDGTSSLDKVSSVNGGSINSYRAKIIENKNFFYKNKWFI